jgi:multiple sugar transport system ATP-binding protein
MAQVLMKDLNKKYDEVHAVKDVNLHIRDKEFIVLVGPSGCGKTTTLRMLAGLEEITAGEIHIGERLVNDLPPKDRDIAMVFQNYALYPHMTVYDNMAFGLKMRKFPKAEIEKRVRDAAEILGIQELLKRKPRQLSGGQRQRVAVAGPSCATRRCSCSTSRCPTWTPSCACRCAWSSRSCTTGWRPRPCTSPTTRSRP